MRSKRNLLGAGAAPLALTGLGVITAAGSGVQALARAIESRSCLLGPLALRASACGWDAAALPGPGAGGPVAGGQVADDVLLGWQGLEADDDRATAMAALAMEEAARDARLVPGMRARLRLGTALGAVGRLEACRGGHDFDAFRRRLLRAGCAVLPGAIVDAPPLYSVTCASGLCALEAGACDLARERADAIVLGAVDALTSFMHGGFTALGALSRSGRLRPFDESHDGIVISEAAAFAVVEPVRDMRRRDGRARACVVSQRLVSDAAHLTSPDPRGEGMARAIAGALSDAGLAPSDIGCITLTATGSAVYDRMLSCAVRAALGEGPCTRTPVTTWEASVGHALAATGVLGLVHAAWMLETGRVHATFGCERLDPECRLDYVLAEPRPLRVPCVLILTVGFGGQNGATIVTCPEMAADLAGAARKAVA